MVHLASFPSSMAVCTISIVQKRIRMLGKSGVPQPQTTICTIRGATVKSEL